MKAEHIIGLVIFVLVGSGIGYLFLLSPGMPNPSALDVFKQPYKEIANPSGFVNTDEITIGELVGEKVILVDFLTYSCINCQRTFPYLTAWYEKYKDQGLEIVGIHTPEFAFEKNIDNVRKAMEGFGITYPIVLDNDYATWRAYGNRYWPRKYLIDIHGNIVYDHIGEGGYEETEMKIRELLADRAEALGESADMDDALASATVPTVDISAQSPETYFGSMRNEYLANGARGRAGEQNFSVPDTLGLAFNKLYLGGTWDISSEYAESVSDATVVYKFNAKEMYIVADSDDPIEVEVWQDGELISSGADVEDGIVKIQESVLYKLIQNEEAGEHTLELRVKGEGVRFYAFTFG